LIGPGIYENMSMKEYLEDPCEQPSLTSSICKILCEKPPIYAWRAHPLLNPNWKPEPWDKRLDEGTLIHSLLLGGQEYIVGDYPDYRTKEAREWRDANIFAGHIPVLRKDMDRIGSCVARVRPRISEEIGGNKEVVYVWKNDGVLCRARIDLIRNNTIYDIKTVTSLSDSYLINQIENYGYDIQAAFYVDGLSGSGGLSDFALRFEWIFVEINEPFETRMIVCDGARMDIGSRKVKFARDKWRACLEMNTWPGYPRLASSLPYLAWAENKWLEREIQDVDSGDNGNG
jgi:PDDEXK-like domain of unknown function (DUF3799)